MEGGQNRGNKYQGLREGNTQKSTLPLNGNRLRLYKPLHGCLSRSNLLSCEELRTYACRPSVNSPLDHLKILVFVHCIGQGNALQDLFPRARGFSIFLLFSRFPQYQVFRFVQYCKQFFLNKRNKVSPKGEVLGMTKVQQAN